MQVDIEFSKESTSDCGCCRLDSDKSGEPYGCSERSAIFTPREQEVLARIRSVGERARELKRSLRRSAHAGGSRSSLAFGEVEELENLRKMRTELEEERLAAAEERMRYLGHI